MKFQKFYIYFSSLSWVIWLITTVTLDIFWQRFIFNDAATIFAFISGLFCITPTHLICSVIALIKSIKARKSAYIIFNAISMPVNFVLGALNFISCLVYYTGGV